VAKAASLSNAFVLDWGTKAGVMELMGEAISSSEEAITLIGVAPSGKTTYPGGPPAASPDTAYRKNYLSETDTNRPNIFTL
jgi:hypothetical protein